MITLCHWDLPQYLHDKGGWTHPESAEWFTDHAERTVALFEDLCDDFITLNEPWVYMHKGYITGDHAPGIADLADGGQLKPILHDMVCINDYSRSMIRHQDGGFLEAGAGEPRGEVTSMNREISPVGFRDILLLT